jgi:SAM-dependent methyltransferase
MQIESKFYERLHTDDKTYGNASYDVARLLGSSASGRWAERSKSRDVAILDIGCGKGQFVLDLVAELNRRHTITPKRVALLDLVRTENNEFGRISPTPEFFQQSVDGQSLPFPDASFDFISCNHVLEHVFETEKFLREIRRVVRPGGLVVISVPNCAAWMNRIFFLFGGMPLGAEVGTESITYGFWPAFMKSKLVRFVPSGHIRDFTPRSLRDLTEACGFKWAGWWAQNGGMIPTWKRNLGILLEPSQSAPR